MTHSVEEFYKAGYTPIGLFGFDEQGCHCRNPDCKALGKHPQVSNWQNEPYPDEEQFDNMLNITEDFEHGAGVLLTDLLVVDCDERNGYEPNKFPESLEDTGTLVVKSGSGGLSRHYYFKKPSQLEYIPKSLEDYHGVDFLSGKRFAVIPESKHASGGVYKTLQGSPADIKEAPQWLVEALKTDIPLQSNTKYSTNDFSDVYSATMAIPNTGDGVHYEDWIRVGMAIHYATGGSTEGFELWQEWSAQSSKSTGKSHALKWRSFGTRDTVVTQATLFKMAEDAGWRRPVTFDDEEPVHVEEEPDGLGFKIDDVDLNNPPGFVGDVVRWMDNQCLYPRRKLVVATALQTIGDIAGLRTIAGDAMGSKANLLTFCVAGSATGKEAVLQSRLQILEKAGLSSVNSGGIKSTQEIVRNLIRNQMTTYTLDEAGYLFGKIESARKKGGTPYLDEIISTIMAVSTKANGYFILTGDMRDEIKNLLSKEIKQLEKKFEHNEDGVTQEHIEAAKKGYKSVDSGLKKPFLSFIGFTTPESFDAIATRENLMNGFLSRTLLVVEQENNPKNRKDFKPIPMSHSMEAELVSLFSPGTFDMKRGRIEWEGEEDVVHMDQEARELMDKLLEFQYNMAESEKEKAGYIPVWRRMVEQVAKISLILGAKERVVTLEDVRWAAAYVIHNIQMKITYCASLDGTLSKEARLLHRIKTCISKKDSVLKSEIINACRGTYTREETEKGIKYLETNGILVYTPLQHKAKKNTMVDSYEVRMK